MTRALAVMTDQHWGAYPDAAIPADCKGELKLKNWAFAITARSTMRKARIALARRLAINMHAMLRNGTEFQPA